jgi:uncharacterized protein YegJ (DUF2314 family)
MSEPVFFASGDDEEMARASALARRTFRYFWRELSWERRRIVPAFDSACVKLPFEGSGKVEHMWIDRVDFDGQNVSGVLLNEPNEPGSVHRGDRVEGPLASLGDWMLAGDTVLGAFTVRVLRSRMSAKEREDHDSAWGLPFGDAAEISVPSPGDDHPMALNMDAKYREGLAASPGELHRPDERGFTLLHREALAGNANIVAILLEHGAKPDAVTKDGRTPLSLARSLGWTRVEALLVAAGGDQSTSPTS